MAKINFGNIVADARGKVGGVVMSKNKSGAYTRTKVTPVNPRTVAQQAARASFGSLSQAWSGVLTSSQRAQWVSYAQTYPRRDIFGNSLTLNGLNMFLSLGAVANLIGVGYYTSPPAYGGINPETYDPTFTSLTTGLVKITLTGLSGSTAPYVYVFATKSLPAGRSVTPSDYRYIYSEAEPAGPPPVLIDLSAVYLAKFGAPIVGSVIYAQAATADGNSGLVTVGSPISGIVT
jgi:hypothetical protein